MVKKNEVVITDETKIIDLAPHLARIRCVIVFQGENYDNPTCCLFNQTNSSASCSLCATARLNSSASSAVLRLASSTSAFRLLKSASSSSLRASAGSESPARTPCPRRTASPSRHATSRGNAKVKLTPSNQGTGSPASWPVSLL